MYFGIWWDVFLGYGVSILGDVKRFAVACVFWVMERGGILGYVSTGGGFVYTVENVCIATSKFTIESVPHPSSAMNSLSLSAASVVFVAVATATSRLPSCVSGFVDRSSFSIALFS